ncbi:Zn(II)2Cys6 transcriptional activator [Fusarium acutatum]|uniref:Zn(II)2Cys6 transcriptional activator n=1 Tax=Fusarium acutatum TaxID=78861 RepID=A0A8H4JD46_9HYPO|nr:Zn(II)2Cys6 transcriptional activator [Fusarium acutatum]
MSFQPYSAQDNDEESPSRLNGVHSDEPRPEKRKRTSKDDPQGPSCSLCRRRKAKCSRDQPCGTCIKLGAECIYDQEKSKPGMRAGAIETLTQRLTYLLVATLENMFIGQGVLWQQIWNSIKQPNTQQYGQTPDSHPEISIQQMASDVRRHLTELPLSEIGQQVDSVVEGLQPGNTFDGTNKHRPKNTPSLQHQVNLGDLPPDDLVDSMNAPELRAQYSTCCRQTVILASMESFSVENLQAMTICAFDIIGSGRGPSAWSIVGSMSRTVEQLRLSTEEEETQSHQSRSKALIERVAFLPPASTWAEVEERRRIFWNVFLMDRFCSICTGWNLSLTSADVTRRLPCEGAIWETGEPSQTPTPYFGISTRSHDREKDYLPATRDTEDGQASLGGFAFCIEATESLSLVTSFFLQYRVDFKEVHEVQRWLMRFKQLDLRLVQWKFFLPEKWRKACQFNNDGNLDPNLVLAHIAHNTAVVLLHQGLAYPPAEWQSLPVRLPSASSAETCQVAADEVATIAEQFLGHSHVLISPQFSFCLFVCGKMLLTHAAYYQSALTSSFDSVISSLEEISRRWNGEQPPARANLASKFCSRLKKARIEGSGSVDIREAFSERQDAIPSSRNADVSFRNTGLQRMSTSNEVTVPGALDGEIGINGTQTESPESISLAFPPLPLSFQMGSATHDSIFASQAKSGNDMGEVIGTDMNMAGNCLDFYDLSEQTFLPAERVTATASLVNDVFWLDAFAPAIQELMKLSGTPGLSLSVATKNQPVYHANYGFRDLQNRLPVTEETIFPVCSLAKGLSAAAMGILVDQGIASWEMLVKDATPSFHPNDRYLYNNTTLADIYNHRSGMSSCGNLVSGCEGNILIGKYDCMRVVNHQTLVPAHLGSFAYDSTAYDACDESFKSLSGTSLNDFLQQQVFAEVGLRRTFMKPPPSDTDNVTESHNALDDGTPWCIPGPKLGQDGIGCGSGGLRSCAADLIELYTCFLQSFNHERQRGQTSTPGSPLKQVSKIMSPHVSMLSTERGEVSYGLGWVRVQLPNTLGHIGLNSRLMPQAMPVIGKGVDEELILYHQGTLTGAIASVILIPRTESVVLVMSNSLSLTDVPDWVSQMVLEEIMDVPIKDRTDFIAYAKTSIAINLGWYDRVVQGLTQGQPRTIKPHRPLESYKGRYVDENRVFSVVVTAKEGVLFWAFQGLDSERYKLTHYDGDTFTWLQPRNDLSRRGRWVLGNDNDPSFWKIEFGVDEHGSVNKLLWRHDPSLDPIVYSR